MNALQNVIGIVFIIFIIWFLYFVMQSLKSQENMTLWSPSNRSRSIDNSKYLIANKNVVKNNVSIGICGE